MASLIASGLFLGIAVAACGDPITASHDWRAVGSQGIVVTFAAGHATGTADVIDGQLANDALAGVAGSSFQERCVRIAPAGPRAFNCITVLRTGSKVYIAAGMAANLFGSLRILTGSSGSLTITKVRDLPLQEPSGPAPPQIQRTLYRIAATT
jgi:hypothetical protein